MGRSLARLRWAARPAGWGPGSQHHWLCVRPGGRAGGRPASPVSLQVTPWAQPCRVLPLRWRVRSGGPVLVSPGTSKLGQLDLLGDPAGVTGMPPAGAGGGGCWHTRPPPRAAETRTALQCRFCGFSLASPSARLPNRRASFGSLGAPHRPLLLSLQTAPRLPGHRAQGHPCPQSAVARWQDGRGHSHSGRVLPLGPRQQRGPVGQAGRAPLPLRSGAGRGHEG